MADYSMYFFLSLITLMYLLSVCDLLLHIQ